MARTEADIQPIHPTDLERQDPLQALQNGLGESLLAVVLFGSRARGDARPESDWDLLVIAERFPDNLFERQRVLHRLLRTGRGPVSLIARTRQEFESRVPSLYLDIALDGRVLYDPAGYATERLAHLRRLTEEAGLYREQTPAGDVWKWRKQPGGPWVITWENIGASAGTTRKRATA